MQYEIPPWIKAPDESRNYLSGLQIGANIAEASSRLEAQREMAAIETQVKMKQLAEQSEERRQRLEYQQAYHDQMVGLRQQQLDDARQKNALATTLAARRFAAQQEYRTRVSRGDDAAKAMLELGPSMGASSGDFGAALRSTRTPEKPQWIPANLETGAPGHFETPTGAVHIPPLVRPENKSQMITATVSELKARRKAITDSLPLRTSDAASAAQKQKGLDAIDAINRRIEKLLPLLREETATNNSTTGAVRDVRRDPKTGKFVIVPQDQLKSHDEEDQ